MSKYTWPVKADSDSGIPVENQMCFQVKLLSPTVCHINLLLLLFACCQLNFLNLFQIKTLALVQRT